MGDMDIYTAGASRVTDPDGTNILPVIKTQLQVDPESGDAEDYGEIPLMPCIGVTALPAAPDANGAAELACVTGVGGFTAVVVGGRDARCVDVVGELRPGESAFHNTGGAATKRSRLICKEDLITLLVGNDSLFLIDRDKKHAILNVREAGQFELSKANGVLFGDSSGAGIQVKDGKILLNGGAISMPGGANIGGDGSTPVTIAAGLMSYLTALELLLVAIATDISSRTVAPSPTPGPAAAALTVFQGVAPATKVAMTALVTNGK